MRYLLPNEGHWYKANLHCHSTLSDGQCSPEELAEVYRKEGYHIVAFSDHRKLIPHPELKREDFLPLTAVELDAPDQRQEEARWRQCYHLNFFAKDENATDISFYDRDKLCSEYKIEDFNRLIADANAAGFLAQYNHPRWSLQDCRDFLPLEGLWSFEVYNTGCELAMLNGWGDDEYVQMMRTGKYLIPTAADDNHNGAPFGAPKCDSFGGFTMIKADELSYPAVIRAMEEQACYASTGPIIQELYVEDGIVHITTDPATAVLMRTGTRETKREWAHGNSLTHVTFDLSALRTAPEYIWFIVADDRGNKAITRAYFPHEWQE